MSLRDWLGMVFVMAFDLLVGVGVVTAWQDYQASKAAQAAEGER